MAFGDADASTPAFASVNTNWTTVGATSGLFTPPAGSLVRLAVMADTSSGANPGNETVTDTIDGATGWTFKGRRSKPDSGSQAGTVALWTKYYASAPVAPIAVTVVGNATGGTSGGFSTKVVAGCTGIEGFAEGSNTAAAVSLSVTSSTNNARCEVAATDWNVQANMTAGTNQTAILASSVGSGPDTRVYVGIQNAVTSPAGAVTMSTASPTSGNANNFIGWFLVPASGATDLAVGTDAVAVAANSPTLSASLAAGNDAVSVAANSPTLSALLGAGNDAVSVAANAPTLLAKLAAGAVAVSVGAFDVVVTSGSNLAVGTDAASVAAFSPTLLAKPGAGNAATAVAANAATLSALLGAGYGAVSVGAFNVTLTGAQAVNAGAVAVAVGAFNVTLTSSAPGLVGEAHGPLPLALGAVTAHAVSIAGSIN